LLLAGAVVAALLPVLARGVIDHVVIYDELLHILAARGLLDTGLPAIAGGMYDRGELYTRLAAMAMAHLGDTPVAARLPALVAGATLVFLLVVWVGRKVGMLAGVSAGLFLCLVPGTIDVAVFARFYTLHALVMLVMFAAAFEASLPDQTITARLGWSLLALALLPLGWHLQETTLVAAVAAMAGVLVVLAMRHWTIVRNMVRSHPIAVPLTLLGLAGAGLVVLTEFGFWDKLAWAPLWAAGRAGRHHYYLDALARELPLLWPLLPAAVLIGVGDARTRRIVSFCATVLAVALLIHSFAGSKAVRYVYYVVPMACVAWGVAAAQLIGRSATGSDRVPGESHRWGRWVAPTLLLVALVLSQEGMRALRLASGRLEPTVALGYGAEADWGAALGSLDRVLRGADIVITSNAMKALYYLGRYDYELNVSIVGETDTHQEFGVDPRTGGRAIGSAESVERVLMTPASALVILEEEKIGKASGVPADAVALIESRCRAQDLGATSGLRAWLCQRSTAAP
jgi:hypothetical protein